MSNTVFHQTEKYLKKYKIKYNSVAIKFEVEGKELNENSLYIELQKNNIKISKDNLKSLLKSDYIPHYSPIEEYFSKLKKWDEKTDHISDFCKFVKCDDNDYFQKQFKKWMVRTVKCAIIKDYFNKQAVILVQKGQNTGKTTLCRWLCPPVLSEYIAEDISTDKDARILLAKNFLINLDELALLNRSEINSLKSLFSKTQINERLPYDSKNTILPRIASFLGSTNEATFLNDETGSVRWLCFAIQKIDWNYNKKCNVNRMWAQALHLSKDTKFESEMSIEDVKTSNEKNKKYQRLSTEQELIQKYVEQDIKGQFCTATDIMLHLQPIYARLNKIAIGKALSALDFERIKQDGRYGYLVKLLPIYEHQEYTNYVAEKMNSNY